MVTRLIASEIVECLRERESKKLVEITDKFKGTKTDETKAPSPRKDKMLCYIS